jgi:amino acid adenylation domain-containing protein
MIAPGIQDAYELSPVQAGMLFQCQLDPAAGLYVVQLWTRLSGRLDEAAFRQAWAWVAPRHTMLRTGFVFEGVSRPLQVVHGEVEIPLQTLDWSGADEGEVERRMEALVREDRARGFVLSTPPLLRGTLVRLAEDEHLLMWTLHHLALDGWSYTALFREVLARYDALVGGNEWNPPAPPPYRDFIGWLRGRDRDAAEAFWREALAEVEEPTPLGVDSVPPGAGASGFGDHNLHLSPEATAALYDAARSRRVTLATLIQGAYALVLSRYAGTDDVVFGWTGAGRPESLPGADDICGLFVNTLPARVRVPGDAALEPWLRGIQDRQLAARDHEHTALVDVQGWTGVPRGRPLFESLLTFESFPRIDGASAGTGGLTVGRMRGVSSTGYPLALLVHPGERLHLRAYQDRGRIPDAAAERLLGHFSAALQAVAAAPADARVGEIDVLTADERARLLGDWAGRTRAYPAKPIHQVQAETAARAPERIAVTAWDGKLTYRELEARANRLANHLVALGVRPGEVVGVAVERSAAMIVALLGIVKAGAAYLPLDRSYPPERLAFLMDDAGARRVVTNEATRGALPLRGRRTVSLDGGDAAAIAAAPAGEPRVPVGIGDPLYVVYTSGSTGTPKGVLIPHRALVRLVCAADYADFGPEQVVLQIAPVTFDAAPMEIWAALAHGGRLAVLPPHPPTLDEIGTFIREQGVTAAFLTSGLFHQMVDARLEDLAGVRQLYAGGDVVSVPHARRVMEAHPALRLVHCYGPTENGTFTTTRIVQPGDVERPTLPLGRAIPNTTAYVLDGRLRPVPVGVPGELCAGGDGLAVGYLNRPELTAERFVPDPFSATPGQRLYRTGDRVRWTEVREWNDAGHEADPTHALTHSRTHALEFLGRTDFQVKIRGFRVEPGEVENALQAHPAVRDAAVAARPDPAGGKRLIGWFVGDVAIDEVRAYLRERLPEYMVPAALVRMEALPLNRHDKVDRAALPEPDAAAGSAAEHVPPRTETEELLAALWADVLPAERVGVTEDFFDRGGHSLHAMQLVTRIREALRVDLPLRALFDAPTIAGLAARLAADAADAGDAERVERTARLARLIRRMPDAEVRALLESTAGEARGRTEAARRQELLTVLLRAEGVAADAAEPIAPRGDDAPAPLSFAQERMYLVDLLGQGAQAYTIAGGVRLRGALDVGALRRAFAAVVRRHQALRTTFARVEGTPVQVVAPEIDCGIPLLELAELAEEAREERLQALAAEEAARPFDLATGPLVRLRLARLGEREHALLLFVHHAVADGWSVAVLYRELSALYAAFLRGEADPLPPLAIQYPDFAAWQRRQLEGAGVEAQLEWWRGRLAGLPELLEIPADRPRPAAASGRGALLPVRIPRALADGLRELSRREGATLFMTLLAGFNALLHRYTGETDFAVGTPVSGRGRPETEPLIGMFVNTLVLRADLAGAPGFRALLARVREAALGAFAHQDVPFERLVEELRPARSLGHTPLVQVMFALQNAGDARPRLEGITAERIQVPSPGARCDLVWSLRETEAGIEGVVEYATDLFDAATVRAMAEHFQRLLAAACADPAAPVAALPLVAEEARGRLLALGEGAAAPYPAATVDAVFAARAAEAPEAAALAWAGGRMTYGELEARANRLARHLRRHGVRHGTRVGICLERGAEHVAATLAVLKAGGAYVPLDAAYPAERLAFMLADTTVPVLVTDAALAERLPEHAARLVRVDADAEAIAAEPAAPVRAGTVPASAAYVMYTSGSTGRPKGVEVPHRAIVRLACGQDWASIGPSDVVLHLATASFDAATLELWPALLNGARVALHPPEQPSLDSLARAVAEHGVTLLWLTAGLFHAVVEQRIGALRGVRQLLAGGDVLSVPHVRRVLAELPGTRLVNGYGPTENTVFTTCHAVEALAEDGAAVPIGRPIANSRVRVLDAWMQPVPEGVPGELFAGGDGLALGYVNAPALTAERFVPDPFVPGARLYRTGDRVRWKEVRECVSASVREWKGDEDSREATNALTHSRTHALEFLGRVDGQAKIRGFRVEPGEVEAALRAHPAVAEAAAAVRGQGGAKRLVAWVLPREGGEVDAAELAAFLKGRLPEHLLPAAIGTVDEFPRTPSGKVDRRALPDPEPAAAAEHVEPDTATERAVAAIFAEVLGAARVGAADEFFALGGHSLSAMHVCTHLRDRLGVELPLRALFENPTVRGLAARVDAAPRADDAQAPVIPLRRVPRRVDAVASGGADGAPAAEGVDAYVVPASFSQQRLWMLDRMDPGSALYAVPVAVRIRGALDAEALQRALDELAARHESLRTVFRWMDGGTAQVVLPAGSLPVRVVDLSRIDADAREGEVRRRLADEAARPFDLAAGPLVRVRLYRLDADEHVLLLNLHHVVTDGWSNGVLLRELEALYGAFARGLASPLPAPALQYADYAEWQRERLRGAVYDRQLAYWTQALAGAPARLELPTDRPRPAAWRGAGAVERFRLPAEVAEAVEALARAEECTPFTVLLAVFQALLGRYARQDDVVVGTPVANRARPETRDVVGFFVNTLALRGDLSGDPGFRALLHRVRDATLGAFAHQEMPFERLVDELKVPRSAAHAPVFQAMFILQTAGDDRARLPGLAVEPVAVQGTRAAFDLTLALRPREDGMDGAVEYATDLFDRATALRLVDHFRTLLAAACAAPDAPLSALPLLSDGEVDAALRAWEGPALDSPPATIHARIAAQAVRTPDAVAVEGGGGWMTYAELEDRAARLADRLRALGVRPGVIAAVRTERSVEAVIAILGVLKAGGAYLPLDPSYPAERQAYMLMDSGASLLLDGTGAGAPHGWPGRVADLAAELAASAETPTEREPAIPYSLFPIPCSPDDLAYVIYTSGSTGRPKGVAVPHRALSAYVDSARQAYGLTPDDRVLQFAPLSFDSSVEELFAPLAAGATMVLRDEEMLASVDGFWRAAERQGLTVASLPTAFWHEIAAAMDRAAPPIPSVLRMMIVGGERALPERVASWRRGVGNGVRLINSYGPTETTVAATLHTVQADEPVVPIGRPMPGYRVRVLDASLRPVSAGIPGELFVGGIGVARGYLGRPALTAEKFVPDPFATAPGERLYRTGDLVRWKESASVRECVSALVGDSQGAGSEPGSQPPFTHALTHPRTHALEFLGRTDDQVKVRGFRIEPGEIESLLRRQPGVRDAVVAVREDVPGDRRLAAYLVPDGSMSMDAIRAAVRAELPAYMLPSAFVVLDALPMTPSGKVDRRALPAPQSSDAPAATAPLSRRERAVAEIWREVLGADAIGPDDNFFDLGGNSLLLIRLAGRLKDELGSTATAVDLFRFPTVRALAAHLAGGDAAVADPPATGRDERLRQGTSRLKNLRKGVPA